MLALSIKIHPASSLWAIFYLRYLIFKNYFYERRQRSRNQRERYIYWYLNNLLLVTLTVSENQIPANGSPNSLPPTELLILTFCQKKFNCHSFDEIFFSKFFQEEKMATRYFEDWNSWGVRALHYSLIPQ